jgi:hypothetical protein
MPTVPLVALKPHRYDGRLVRKGQTFAARSLDDALVLKMMRVATDAQAEPPVVPVLVPEPVPEVDESLAGSPEPERPRRRYRRKDLVAEE